MENFTLKDALVFKLLENSLKRSKYKTKICHFGDKILLMEFWPNGYVTLDVIIDIKHKLFY